MNKIGLMLICAALSATANGAALLQPSPCRLSKHYSNGDSILIECNKMDRADCVVEAMVDGAKTKVSIPFSALGLIPELEMIRLFPIDKHEFSVALDVQCPDQDVDLLPPATQTVVCIANFRIVDGAPSGHGSLQVLAIPNASSYRALERPKK